MGFAVAPEYVILHHSVLEDQSIRSWGWLRDLHVKTFGWPDIGYHFGVAPIDGHYELLIGRTVAEPGHHCEESWANRRSVGICLIGDFDSTAPPLTLLQATARIVSWAMWEFTISRERVLGHRDLGLMTGRDWRRGQYVSCPGRQFSLEAFRELLPPFL